MKEIREEGVHVGTKMKISSLRKSVILWSFLGYFEMKNRVSGAARRAQSQLQLPYFTYETTS